MKNAIYLILEVAIPFWEDAIVNGQDDTDGDNIPARIGDLWSPVIRLADGQIMNWKYGTVADTYYKVCDTGSYYLADANKTKIAKWIDSYVPEKLINHTGQGFGDYIFMHITHDGKIMHWKCTDITPSEWTPIEAVQ